MARMARPLSKLVLLAAALATSAAPAVAQPALLGPAAPARPVARYPQSRPVFASQAEEQIAPPSADAPQPQILQSLPDVPSEPRSLFAPAAPLGPPPPDLEHPYFQRDPLLDPSDWPQPGWFADVQIGAVKPVVDFPVADQVTTGAGLTPAVQLGVAHLNWAVAPRFEIGYRLPSGFGEISVSDRFFNTGGSDTIMVPDGPAHRSSTFFVNYTDIDYGSREFTPNVGWGLKWRGGLRAAQTYLGTRVDEPLAEAAAGSTIFAQRQTNRTMGAGPHFSIEVDRRFASRPGLTWVNQLDLAEVFTRIRQSYFAADTMLTPTGFDSGSVVTHFLNINPILTAQIGLSYQPPGWSNSRFYLGYFGQFWYQQGTNSNLAIGPFLQAPATHFTNQGVVLQWSWNH
jgi:hypothetical protein